MVHYWVMPDEVVTYFLFWIQSLLETLYAVITWGLEQGPCLYWDAFL